MKIQKKNIHGIILLDKAAGMSSNQALQKVKRLFNAAKAGHTGSLDPLATGLLPICLGQATKISEYLLNSSKKYSTVIKLGETTNTLDREGEVVETKMVNVSDLQIQSALGNFIGDIKQVPPMFSALKKDGQPLYKLARKGEVIERAAREMTVHSLQATRLDALHLRLDVHCSSGFYVRSLAHDLGQALGCGAHVTELRRTAIKDTGVDQALTYEQLEKSNSLEDLLLPIDSLITDMPILEITDAQARNLLQGKATVLENSAAKRLSRLYTEKGQLFGIGRIGDNGLLKTHKMFITGD